MYDLLNEGGVLMRIVMVVSFGVRKFVLGKKCFRSDGVLKWVG